VAARHLGLLLQISGTTLADMYEARSLLEPEAVALLAARRRDEDLTDLARCIDELEAAIPASQEPADLITWTQSALRFHDLLMARAGNKTLAIQYQVLREVADSHLVLAASQPGQAAELHGAFGKVIRSYRRLLGLIRAGDADGARAHWRTHMAVAGRALLPEQLRSQTVLDMFSDAPACM
jgi:DNA-binding FadR family transcriptional regulator